MSTIYTFHAECSSVDTIASGDKFLIYDVSTGRTEWALASDVATYAGASPALVSPSITGSPIYTGTASTSFQIGATLSSRIGFYGIAGTSQPASAAQGAVTNTVHNPTTCTGVIGFSTTAAMQDVLNLLIQIRAALVANGLIKGSV